MTAVPMSDRDDFQLVREYADHGSQPAFGELVRRYIDLVYSSAARQVRDPGGAEDVTQTVFIVLARRARELRPGLVLSGWLLGVTRFAVKDHLKRARRRRHYEQAAALERTAVMVSAQNSGSLPHLGSAIEGGEGDTQARQALANVLDDALARLASAARDAMVLRFFENQSFKQVGQRLGISEVAARQRVFRALEQLRTILARRGVSLGGESLAVALAATAVLPAPSSLSTAVAATVSSASAAASYATLVKGTVTLMKLSTIKPAVVSALVLLVLLLTSAAVIKWPKGEQRQVVLTNPSPAPPTLVDGVRPGIRTPLNFRPPENYPAPNFGWVTPPRRAPAPYAGPPITGTVKSPEGDPLAGAEIMVVTSISGQGGWAVEVDNPAMTTGDGRFELRPKRQPAGLFIRSPQGHAWVGTDVIKPDQNISLSAWGRLELAVKQGAQPMARAQVILRPIGVGDLEAAFGTRTVLADAEGRATAEYLLRGEHRITWAADDSKLSTRERNDLSKVPPREIRVNVEPGKTQQMTLGGMGRPITGSIDGDIKGFNHRRGLVRPKESGPLIYFDAKADGSFTVMDVPAGDYEISIDLGIAEGKNIKIAETYAVARSTFKMPADLSDQPLDIGKLPVTDKKVLGVGEAFPKLTGKNLKGEAISIQDFHGQVLLVQVGPPSFFHSRAEIDWQHSLYARFADDPAFAMLTVMTKQALAGQTSVGDPPVPWPVMVVDPVPGELEASNARLFLVNETGNLAAKNITAAQVYAMLDWALEGKADPRVKFDFVARAPAKRNPPFDNIPAPAADDAAASARVSLVAGVPSWDTPKSDVTVLTDGKFPKNEDAPAEALFFQAGTLEGRFRIDLKDLTNVAEIRTYSWHKDTRAAQVYRVFGSDGTAPNFEPNPGIGVDPTKQGWTSIAFVDTRPEMKPVGIQDVAEGGRYVSSITDKEKGTLGTYRHLLFQVFVIEADDVFGHTFYSEIDVIAAK
jgi:RNA polymerase sigma factor (sigma-70 family)